MKSLTLHTNGLLRTNVVGLGPKVNPLFLLSSSSYSTITSVVVSVPKPVWFENLPGVVIRPDKSRHKHRWSE